jgi:hypothetical protein
MIGNKTLSRSADDDLRSRIFSRLDRFYEISVSSELVCKFGQPHKEDPHISHELTERGSIVDTESMVKKARPIVVALPDKFRYTFPFISGNA